jgi:hypothetical protein
MNQHNQYTVSQAKKQAFSRLTPQEKHNRLVNNLNGLIATATRSGNSRVLAALQAQKKRVIQRGTY